MKKIGVLLSFTILFIAATCENEPLEGEFSSDNDVNNMNNPSGDFQVDFDGQTYIADIVSATVLDDVMNITGLRGTNGESVILTVFGNSPGTYQLGIQNGVEANVAAYSEGNNTGFGTWVAATDFITSQGEITLSEIDEVNQTLSGTFFFTGNNPSILQSKEFINGSFTNIPYEVELVNNNNNNIFFAKVDDEEFVEDSILAVYTDLLGNTSISVVATKNNLETISLTFSGDIVPGSYDFDFGVLPIGQYNIGTTGSYLASGAFNIELHDTTTNRIKGTFQFTAQAFPTGNESFEITEGSFDVTYD